MTRRRSAVRALLAGVLLALVASSLATGPAQASSLTLTPPSRPLIATFARPCAGPVVVTPTDAVGSSGKYRRVTVTGLTGSCAAGLLSLSFAQGGPVPGTGTAVPVVGGAFTVTPTKPYLASAIDPRVFVSGDTWPVAAVWNPSGSAFGACAVTVVATGATTGTACTVSGLRVDVGGSPGYRTANVYATISAPGMPTDGSERPYLVLDLAAATGLPTDWQWGNAGAVGSPDNVVPFPGAQCSALPLLQVYGLGWAANPGTSIYFQAVENRTGVSGLLCS